MQEFIARFADQVQGTLSGFDRVLFRGSIRRLTHAQGMKMYLIRNGLLCKEFADHVKRVSADVKEAALEPFHKQGLPVRHIYDSHLDKDQIARTLAAELQILQGDVCALTAMEISPTFQHVNTGMEVRPRPTLVVYQYRIDPEFGWMHSRIQTWFPFYIHVCINGREWLGRRMDAAGMHYLRQDNCFPWIEDVARAQCLMDEQIHVDWNTRLQSFADRLNPLHQHIFRNFDAGHVLLVGISMRMGHRRDASPRRVAALGAVVAASRPAELLQPRHPPVPGQTNPPGRLFAGALQCSHHFQFEAPAPRRAAQALVGW